MMSIRASAWLVLTATLAGVTQRAPLMQPDAFEIVALADGVHAILRADPPDDAANANVLVIVNQHDVIVVDANLTPASARAAIAAVRALTPLPVRYVINTHWHDDHVLGNVAYAEAFPGVEFIGHPVTRQMVIDSVGPALERNRTGYPETVASIDARLASGVRRDGQPLTAEDRHRLTRSGDLLRGFIAEMPGISIVPPTLLVDRALTFWRGDREIRVQFLGRGNTAGDLIVHLPADGIIATGDLLVHPTPYGYGAYPGAWIDTLTALEALAPRAIVPGHGPVLRDARYLAQVRDVLTTIRDHMRAAVARGLTLEQARATLDIATHVTAFAGDHAGRRQSFHSVFVEPVTERAWLEARGELK